MTIKVIWQYFPHPMMMGTYRTYYIALCTIMDNIQFIVQVNYSEL